MAKNNILKIKNLNLKEEEQESLDSFQLKVKRDTIHSILFRKEENKNKLIKFLRAKSDFQKAQLFIKEEKISQKQLKELDKKIYLINQYSAVNPEKDPLGIFKFNKKDDKENKSTIFPEMTIAENIFFGREPIKSFLFFKSIDKQKMNKKTASLLSLVERKLDPNQKMVELNPLEKQLVEMLKAFSYNPDILLIDQAVLELTEDQQQVFFNFMQKLREKGITIVYFTKEIEEVFATSDFVTVLKDGKNKGSYQVSELEYNELALLLMGR